MRTLLLPDTMVWLPTARAAAPRRTDLGSRTVAGTPSTIGALLIAVLVLGLGPGCGSSMTGDPTPGMLRVVSGADASRDYVRAAAAALPVTRGLPCPTSSLNLEGNDAPRPAIAPAGSTVLTVAVRSRSGERR